MAVTEQFEEQWLECQEKYGKNIEAGDIPVLELDRVDEALSLPGVKFTRPYDPTGENVFDSYVHVPMQTFKKPIDDLKEEVSQATSDLTEVKEAAIAATGNADEAADTANTAAQNADASREAIELNEQTRQQNEQIRQQQETARETRAGQDHQTATTDHSTATQDHSTATTDHSTATQDHSTATTDHGIATQDHSTATSDHDASVAATTAATNVNADLTGMTVTITNRQGVSKSVNIGFEILEDHVYPSVAAMNADAANVRAGEFCMIAATDPTSTENAQLWSRNSSAATSAHPFTFLSDLDQASSAAFADWLENYKPVIEADHTRAEQDHSTAVSDHSTATTDHSTATTDHSTATQDHSTATNDHQISAQQQATFETNEAARQDTFDTNEQARQDEFDTNEAQRQEDFENAEADRIAAMTVTRCFIDYTTMHLKFVQVASDSTQYKLRYGRLKILTTFDNAPQSANS
ncbi:MAG: hypothetical protein K6F74_05695 [Prevotella sp.]|nr:hypothetical protein [Prevotella sp.]